MKISIITVSFNSEKTISKCIESVNSQVYSNIEHILIDGNSSDSTLDIFKNLSKFSGPVISEPDKGIYDAMNKGIALSTGEIIGFLNSDDFFYSSKSLSLIAESFTNGVQCVYGNLLYLDENNNIKRNWISKNFKKGMFSKSWSPAHPTFYCLKSVYENYSGFNINYKIASDIDLMLRFLEVHKIKFKYINYYLVNMLEGGLSSNSILSTFIITKEVRDSHKENKIYFNLSVYIFSKIIKAIKQKSFKKIEFYDIIGIK